MSLHLTQRNIILDAIFVFVMPQNHVSIPCFPLLVTFENILIYPISLPLFKIIPEELSQSLKSLVSIQLLTHLFSPSGFLNGNTGIVGRRSERPTKLPKTPNVLCLEWAIKFRDLENICLKNWQLSSSQPDLCLCAQNVEYSTVGGNIPTHSLSHPWRLIFSEIWTGK